MRSQPRVSLCIVNYNGEQRLPRTLTCIDQQSWRFDELILVDDASQDQSVQLVQQLNPLIRVIQQGQNSGPGAARNSGFHAAKNDLILFLDNDVYLQTNTASVLIEHLQRHADALLVAPRVIYDDDPERIQYDSADCHFLGLMATRNADLPVAMEPGKPTQTDSVVTACFLINRRFWGAQNLFDESFGFNMEDHDFGLRSRLLGHQLWVQPEAQVRHGSGTPGLSYRPGQQSSAARLLYLTRNRWLIVGKCFSAQTLLLLAPAFLVFEIMQLTWLATQGHIDVWWRALGSLCRRWDYLQEQRRVIQRSRRIGDGEVLRDLPLPLTAQVRSGRLSAVLIGIADRLLRGYFKLVRRALSGAA